jgi:hypothetical protein
MLEGLPEAYERIATYARKDPTRWPLVTSSTILGSILTYAYDVPTVLLNDAGITAAGIGGLQGQLGVGFDPFGLHNTTDVDARVAAVYLDHSAEAPPSELVALHVPLEAGEFGPNAFDLQIPAAHLAMHTRAATPTGNGALAATGERAVMQWGPWIDLAPGRYRIEWYGSIGPGKRKRRGTLDVVSDGGKRSIAKVPLLDDPNDRAERLLGGIDFTVTEPTSGVEFRVRLEAQAALTLTRLRLARFVP